MKTIREVTDVLAQYDEITVLELLDVSSEELVIAFKDLIEEKQDYLRKALDLDDETDYYDNDEEGDS